MVTIGDLENNEIESIHIEGITNIPLIKGEQGEKGDKGDKGETNNIKIGTVETGEKASATLEGESPNQILNLVLPKGDKGEQGEPGIKPVKGIDYFTEEEIQEIKSNILDQVNQFSVLVVEELPTDNIDEHTIYFLPKTKTEQNDVYDEFIYINNGWEHIGTTEVDLSSYYKKDEIDTKLEAVEGNEVFVGNEEEAPSSAKIIVEEDDFVEGSTLGKAEVYVGAEEPTAGEKVWFRKGKNKFNPNDKTNGYLNINGSFTSATDWTCSGFIEINSNKYILSANTTARRVIWCEYDGSMNIIGTRHEVVYGNPIAIVSTNTKYIKVCFNDGTATDIQLEQGSKATTYEAYIEPQIFVRNSNGVYEEFAKKSEEVYSTEEQRVGTWIDGKPLYRKVVNAQFGTVVQGTETTVEVNLKNVDFILVDKYWLDRKTASSAINQGYVTDALYLGYTSFNNSNTTLRFRTKQSWVSNTAIYAIIEYTKTTD